MKDRLVVGCTLRNWAFAVTTADTNPEYDMILHPGLRALSGRVGWGALCSADR